MVVVTMVDVVVAPISGSVALVEVPVPPEPPEPDADELPATVVVVTPAGVVVEVVEEVLDGTVVVVVVVADGSTAHTACNTNPLAGMVTLCPNE